MVKLGIIGFGRIGAEHARWIAQARGLRAVAVADATPARQEMARDRGLALMEFDQMLSNPDVDAVLIATPTAMHFDHARSALLAGKHAMVEKPVTLNLPQARELGALAAERERVLSVFHNRRWDADYLTVRQAIASGILGRVINVESRLSQWESCVGPAAPEWHPQWRNEAQYGGGALYDWGSHFIDQIWQLMLPAKPLRVFAQLRGNVWTRDCDDFARILIDFDNGATGLVEINTTTTLPLPRWHIDGTQGSVDSPHSPNFDVATWARLRWTASDRSERDVAPAPLGLTECDIWEQFAQAIETNAPPAVPIESVFPTMALLDATRQSSRSGSAVSLAQRE